MGGKDQASRGGDIFEIDYRGPETHSYIPPPDLNKGTYILLFTRHLFASNKCKWLYVQIIWSYTMYNLEYFQVLLVLSRQKLALATLMEET